MLNLIAVLVFLAVCLTLLWATRGGALRRSGGDAVEAPARTSFLDRWEQTARQAGLPWQRGLYVKAALAGLLLCAALALTANGGAAFAAATAGFAGPVLYVQHLAARRRALFARQLPQALMLAASVLRSGGSLLQAVDAVAADMPDPMGTEFRHIQAKMRLQVPAHEAMAETQARMNVREFAAAVVAARITTEVGGNLAHIFDQVARSVIDAQNAQRTVKAFTTEGRMSANVIAALPFLVMALVHFLTPGYFDILLQTWAGRAILVLCVGAIGLGWALVRRMVDIQVH